MPDDGSWGLNEIAFLQKKSDAGKLVIVTGTRTTTGVVTSYTPANGVTFVLFRSKINPDTVSATGIITGQLRNNGTVLDAIEVSNSVAGVTNNGEFIIEGDTLVGDGAKTYDINISVIGGGTVRGTIIGYLE